MRPWLIAAAIALSGCAGQPVAPPVGAPPGPEWQARQQALESIQQWRLSGRVGVTHGEDAWSGRLNWAQSGGSYEIVLTSPFGQGGVRLQGGPSHSELHVDNDVVVAEDAETLLARQFGWQLPVEDLRYWLVGLPSPGLDKKVFLDGEGRISKLQERGWEVDFRRYVKVDGVELPGKIFVTHPDLEVRLVVDRWEVLG